MQHLLEHVARSIRERKLCRPAERILVAVSGGLDSMVLLHLLHHLSPRFGWKLVVAHFNHQLRGRASAGDEKFVRRAATRLGWPVRVARGDVTTYAEARGLSIEMAARDLRHRFLARAARRSRCPVLVLAHQADDQVELFFLRLLRGAGGAGLAGMKWRSVSPADQRVRLVRPLLDVSRETLERFARHHAIRHREDASNACLDLLRNRVRHELLPLLRRRFQPALAASVRRAMEVVGAEAGVVNDLATAWLKAKHPVTSFAKSPIGLQRRILQLQLRARGIEPDFDLIETLRLAPDQPVTVRPGLRLGCDRTGRISRVPGCDLSFATKRKVLRIKRRGGSARFAGATLRWRLVSKAGGDFGKSAPGQEQFDADRIGPKVVLRHWQAGDRFQPIGMKSPVKLQDWFTNRKVPAAQRRRLIVATTPGGEVFWVEGQRIAERFKLTEATRRRLIWRWKRPETT